MRACHQGSGFRKEVPEEARLREVEDKERLLAYRGAGGHPHMAKFTVHPSLFFW